MASTKKNINIDDEWSNFLTNKYDDTSSQDDESLNDTDCYDAYGNQFKEEDIEDINIDTNINSNINKSNIHYTELNDTLFDESKIPEPTQIYISTKSKIAYLTQPVDLNIFWNIPIISYSTAKNGVIKKQIKINSKTPEELEIVQERLQKELYYEQHIMSHIINPNGRIKFKDIRKITIGISKKDIMSYRSKKKQAFYNCFVMILRIKINDLFREFHIKVFNTGKLEIPGVQSDEMYNIVLSNIIDILQPFYSTELTYFDKSDTVLINSNFNCGFYVNREALYDILRNKYNIQAIYDPCSYPGIQCKFYYNKDIGIQTGMQITTENKDKFKNITEVSFMIFRTGSVLIVGMCDEYILHNIYEFLKILLKNEFKYICQKLLTSSDLENKDKKKKIRRKTINILTGVDDTNSNTINSEDTNMIEYKEIVEKEINDLLTLNKVKKQRKPRKSKKEVQLEIVEDA